MLWISCDTGGPWGKVVLTKGSLEDLQIVLGILWDKFASSDHGGVDFEGDLELGGEIKGGDDLLEWLLDFWWYIIFIRSWMSLLVPKILTTKIFLINIWEATQSGEHPVKATN